MDGDRFSCRLPSSPASPCSPSLFTLLLVVTFTLSQCSLLLINCFIQLCTRAPGSWAVLLQLPLLFLARNAFPFLPCLSLDSSPQTFGIPLFQVIANDCAYKQLQDAVKKSRRLCLEVEATVTRFRAQRQKRSPMGRSCVLVPHEVFPEEPLSPALLNNSSWSQRRVWWQNHHTVMVLQAGGGSDFSHKYGFPGSFLKECELFVLHAGWVLVCPQGNEMPVFHQEGGLGRWDTLY